MAHLSSALSRAVAVVVVLTMMAIVAAAPAVAAKPTKCQVVDPTSDTSYKSLQAAVDGSPAGAKLRVKGTCVRPTTISRDIKVVGKSGHGFGRATLDGDHRGSVLTIQGGTVTLRGLLITNGVAPSGGGIHVRGSMTLIDTVVSGNTATGEGGEQGGGGVGIDSGTITLVDSIVRNNTAAADGGGIYVGLLPGGDLSVHGTSSVRGNHAGRTGGGIYVDHFSRFSIYDFSSIDHNSAGQRGGGVKCADCGVVALNGDASIHHNTADVAGGGIESGGTGPPLHLRDRSSIHDNTAPDGGGAWLLGSSLDMSGTSSIYHNTAAADGGGAFCLRAPCWKLARWPQSQGTRRPEAAASSWGRRPASRYPRPTP